MNRPTPFISRLLKSYSELQVSLVTETVDDTAVEHWRAIEADFRLGHSAGQLDGQELSAAATIVSNVSSVLAGLVQLNQYAQRATGSLEGELNCISSTKGWSPTKRQACHVPPALVSFVEQAAQQTEHTQIPTSPLMRVGHSPHALREWFLTHLPYPYPTYSEKRNLALQDGIPLSKIDSDLTNWRRRSGWAEIRKIYAKGSKEKMKSLLLRVERGEDTRPDLLDRIEGIRRYMDKESHKVGDWVHELASFARPDKRPKLDHASPTNTNTSHAGHRSISSVSSSSSLSDISAFATMDDQPSHAHTHDSPSTRSVSASSTLSDASIVIPSQGPKRSMCFADDEQVANKAKTSHTPLRAEPTWVDSPTEYASSDPSSFSATLVSLGGACNTLSSLTSSSDSSLPSTDGDDGEQTGYEAAAGSATAVSDALTVTDTVMSSECSSIWSTELELPSLPHMHERPAGSWRIPTLSEFRPEIGRWVQRG